MDEGRKRVLAIVAGILVARHLKTPEDLGESRPKPANRVLDRVRCAMGRSDHDADRWRVRQFTGERKTMTATFEETLISVWRQALVEDRKTVTLEGVQYPVRPTSRSKLREVDFRFEEQTLRGLEQNPNTNSRWAQLAREGKKVMQFVSDGRYIANVVDGKLQFYGRRDRARSTTAKPPQGSEKLSDSTIVVEPIPLETS
jgi:hypothetical protein